MSKSILVIDTPELCIECPLFKHDLDCIPEYYCNVSRKEIIILNKKQDWCPLLDLPEKANHPDYCDNGRYDKGWNDCIDEILKGENGNE